MRGIKHIGIYTSEKKESIYDFINSLNDDLLPSDFENKEDYFDFVENILGYQNISIENEYSERMMLDKLIVEICSNYNLKEIDSLVIVSEENIKNMGHDLIHKHGFENIQVLNISGNNCSNIDNAINLVCRSDYMGNTLILTHIKHKTLKDRIFESYAIKGDGAGIILINNNPKLRLLCTKLLTHGLFSNLKKTENNSMINLKYYIQVIRNLLEDIQFKASDIDYIILQNANHLLFIEAIRYIGLDEEKVFKLNNMNNGHLDGIDLLINLNSIMNLKQSGLKILTLNTGWMGSYAASIFETI